MLPWLLFSISSRVWVPETQEIGPHSPRCHWTQRNGDIKVEISRPTHPIGLNLMSTWNKVMMVSCGSKIADKMINWWIPNSMELSLLIIDLEKIMPSHLVSNLMTIEIIIIIWNNYQSPLASSQRSGDCFAVSWGLEHYFPLSDGANMRVDMRVWGW